MNRLFIILVIAFPITVKAQPESISRELASLINVPALIAENDPPVGSHSTSTTLHFDKLVVITTTSHKGKLVETFLYINTRNGDIAVRTGKLGTLGDGALNANDEDFLLTYYSQSGLVYNYYNRKKRGVLEHYVSSLNTELVAYSPQISFENTWVFQSGPSRTVLPQAFKATPYRASGESAPKIYLCGGPKPDKLLLKRMIGYSGIGYVKTDKGIYMVVEVKSGEGAFTTEKWRNVNYALDKSPFKSAEGEMFSKAASDFEKQLNEQESTSFSGDCADIANNLNQLKIQHTKERQRQLEKVNKGNLISDASPRNALTSMIDPLPGMEEALLGNELSLCRLAARGVRTDKDRRKENCLLQRRQDAQNIITELKAIDQRYPNDKLKAHQEKMRVMAGFNSSLSRECAGVL